MVKLVYIFLTLFVVSQGSCPADQVGIEKLFESGVELYKQGKFELSAETFEQVLESGAESGSLYFNLGNCYFKLGKLGKARVAFEKAKYFLPRDHELNGNLAYLFTKLEDKVEFPQKNIFLRIYLMPSEFFNRNEMALFVLIVFFVLILLWLGLIFRIPLRRVIMGVSIVVLMIFMWLSSVLYFKIKSETVPTQAVVMFKEIPVRWGNTDDDKVAFYLHEGTKVLIRQQRGNWLLITIGNDKTGWIKNSFVEVL